MRTIASLPEWPRRIGAPVLGVVMVLHGLGHAVLPLRGAGVLEGDSWTHALTVVCYTIALVGFVAAGAGALGVVPFGRYAWWLALIAAIAFRSGRQPSRSPPLNCRISSWSDACCSASRDGRSGRAVTRGKEGGMGVPHSAHEWLAFAEHAALRVVMVATGFTLMILGLGLGVSMVMLPAGLLLGLTGFGVLVWGALGELPIDK